VGKKAKAPRVKDEDLSKARLEKLEESSEQ
jgi:hypothetical protein